MTTNPKQLCGIPSNLCVLFRPVHSPALPIPCCIFSSLLKPLIVLPHQRRAWFLFCWENWSFHRTCESFHQLAYLLACFHAYIHYFLFFLFWCRDELSVFLDNVASDRCVPNSIPSSYYSDLIISFSSLPDLSQKHANIFPITHTQKKKILGFNLLPSLSFYLSPFFTPKVHKEQCLNSLIQFFPLL